MRRLLFDVSQNVQPCKQPSHLREVTLLSEKASRTMQMRPRPRNGGASWGRSAASAARFINTKPISPENLKQSRRGGKIREMVTARAASQQRKDLTEK